MRSSNPHTISSRRYGEAEPAFRRALTIAEANQGGKNLQAAISLSNLAALYRIQGRVKEADTMHRRAQDIRAQLAGAGN